MFFSQSWAKVIADVHLIFVFFLHVISRVQGDMTQLISSVSTDTLGSGILLPGKVKVNNNKYVKGDITHMTPRPFITSPSSYFANENIFIYNKEFFWIQDFSELNIGLKTNRPFMQRFSIKTMIICTRQFTKLVIHSTTYIIIIQMFWEIWIN